MSQATPTPTSRPVALPGARFLARHGAAAANLTLRLAYAGMVFFFHGLHKAEEFIANRRTGAPWKLVDEIREMDLPAPFATAVATSLAQLIAPIFIAAGLFTRPAALVLAGVLAGAIAQNLSADRDPQLAALYTLVAGTLALWGAPAFSLDARRRAHRQTA
ncbi:MAG: DoxX family protein [Planctomycetota bacterium]|nr:DoxX family protein [Planctomycetota bacterium]